MRLLHPVVALVAVCLPVSESTLAANSGCDYWDRLSFEEIDGRLEASRQRWLAITPTPAEIEQAREAERRYMSELGYSNASSMVADLDDDFFIRRIRGETYRSLYEDSFTDEEAWIYCVDGYQSECAEYYEQVGEHPAFDGEGRLSTADPQVAAMIQGVREAASEFNLVAQMTMFSYCDCDGSEEALGLCEKAREYLMRDF